MTATQLTAIIQFEGKTIKRRVYKDHRGIMFVKMKNEFYNLYDNFKFEITE